MRYDEYGYICVNGSTDSEDSAHLAGILAVTEHEEQVQCNNYVVTDDDVTHGYYIRCLISKYDFSRDQAILLMVGLLKQGYKNLIRTRFITGKDLIPPSLHGVETIAKRGKPYFFQKWYAMLEVYVHAKFQPLEEPFQVIAMCEAYGLYKFWTSKNKLWRYSIERYLCALDGKWRNEPELYEHVVKYIEGKIAR